MGRCSKIECHYTNISCSPVTAPDQSLLNTRALPAMIEGRQLLFVFLSHAWIASLGFHYIHSLCMIIDKTYRNTTLQLQFFSPKVKALFKNVNNVLSHKFGLLWTHFWLVNVNVISDLKIMPIKKLAYVINIFALNFILAWRSCSE